MEIRLKVHENMTKADELLIMEKLVSAFRKFPNEYLSDFFTPALESWLSMQIMSDFSCNLMRVYLDENKSLQVEIDRLHLAEQALRVDLDSYRRKLDETIQQVEILTKDREALIDERDKAQAQARVIDGEGRKLADEFSAAQEAWDESARDLTDEIIRLKARLFDHLDHHM